MRIPKIIWPAVWRAMQNVLMAIGAIASWAWLGNEPRTWVWCLALAWVVLAGVIFYRLAVAFSRRQTKKESARVQRVAERVHQTKKYFIGFDPEGEPRYGAE